MAQLLSNLPIGAKVKFGKHQVGSETPWDISWLIVAKSHVGYPANSVTLLAEKCINQLTYDAIEPDNADSERKTSGNNKYAVSNIDQWLNSSNAEWYTSRHRTDTPPSAAYLNEQLYMLAYDDKYGFLYNFNNNERNAILATTIRDVLNPLDGGGYEDVVRKVFLPSVTEIGNHTENGIAEGSQWEWFINNPNRTCVYFTQAHTNLVSPNKPTTPSGTVSWWTRTAGAYDNGSHVRYYMYDGDFNTFSAVQPLAVRPALNLSSTLKVSDTTDSDGCYTFILNSAPPKPNTITLPDRIFGGKTNVISWSNVVDPEGDVVTYQLECSYNNSSTFSTIYTGTANSYAHLTTYDMNSITYRVKAIDTSNESSAYTTSANVTIVNNKPPVISGTNANLGVKSAGFTGTYTVTDGNSDIVTVTEYIDGVQIRSLVATLGEEITYGVTGTTWLALPNGSHTLSIRATDGIDLAIRNYTFTKLVNEFTIQNSKPWDSDTMPTRIMLVITRNIPLGAKFKVEVCRNGYSTSPTWEDATDAVVNGLAYVFNPTNTSNTGANKWGMFVKVTVNRNGATGACYVSAIGGNFE